MKILTNIQTSPLGGIGQTFSNLVNSLNKNNPSKIKITGIEVASEPNSSKNGIFNQSQTGPLLKIISIKQDVPYFGDIIKTVNNVDEIRKTYSQLIDIYISIIKKEKPSFILINGTYFVPWCLFQAANQQGIPAILHYHGILTKECAHYDDKLLSIISEMEKTFDNDRLFYIFPSELAKNTVENEVFGHKISRSAIIRNAIPRHFFKINTTGSKKNVAYVGRWSAIKNPEFIKKIATYDKRQNDNHFFNIVSNKEKAEKEIGHRLNNIKIYAPMDTYKLAKFYERMGVVLSPSIFETYGNVAQEAVATGTPAIVSPNMGVAEIFKEIGLSQWIVDFKSTKKVHQKIKEISGQPVDRKIKKILKYNLTSDTINKNIIDVFKSI